MRVWLVPLTALCAGLVLGLGSTAHEFMGVRNRFTGRLSTPSAQSQALSPTPRWVVVNGDQFDFGVLARNEERVHRFVVRNEGRQTLTLRFHTVSCGLCVKSDFTRADVPPQQSVEIPVRYATKREATEFTHFLELSTNEPNREMLRLNIVGKVTERVRLSTERLFLGTVAANAPAVDSFEIYSFESRNLQVVEHQFLNAEEARYFEIGDPTPLDVDTLDLDPLPQAAVKLDLRIRPGLPIGPFDQTIRLDVHTTETASLYLTVNGRVESDVSLFGTRGFDAERNLLSLGSVMGDAGKTVTVFVRVKGPDRDNVQLDVESVEPDDVLRATLGEPRQEGEVLFHPLEIEIIKGARPVNHLGMAQAAKIVIGTTHADARQVPLHVSFATE